MLWFAVLLVVAAGLYVFIRIMIPVMRVLLVIALFFIGLGSALVLIAYALSPQPIRDLVMEITFGLD
ncbi:MAG: hypothetical protein AABM33_07650 [Pseudomonadota bacterium]